MIMKTLHIQPRQTGKTTQAIAKFLENPTQTLFVTTNLPNVKIICDKIAGKYVDNIISQKQLIRKLEYIHNWKLIIFDEYLFHKYSEEEYNKICSTQCDLLAYSSINKIYDNRIFNYVKEYKSQLNVNYTYILYQVFLKVFGNASVKEFNELCWNFMTDYATNIIIHPIEEFSHISKDRLKKIEHIIGQKSFEKEYLNKFLK